MICHFLRASEIPIKVVRKTAVLLIGSPRNFPHCFLL